ncbi:DEAD/DEAH box helicase [Pseudactinotalea sp. HY160]|uniref:ATP-dependent DNA helicase RecG n=1 Tax=Pseudactinotalea sp. HY160 TaxID=2654490 RepID=UPI00128BA4A0|nr:ATP-dependent DNA helicase RecG [Pseudactinotalea sp. HY160]MPV51218.1 DEAD/DEAH box helicase [Pseudactinotalea sp. HY160]
MPAAKDSALNSERSELERLFGKRLAADLATLDLHTVDGLLHHYPHRYVEHEQVTPLSRGRIDEDVTYVARVSSKEGRVVRGGTMYLTTIVFTDGTTDVGATFFSKTEHKVNKYVKELKVGQYAMVAGKLSRSKFAGGPVRELVHPDVRPLPTPAGGSTEAAKPVPIYPATKKCPSWKTEHALRTIIDPLQPGDVADPIPGELRAEHGLMSLHDALRHVHQPATINHAHQARHTLRFHEAFVLQSALARRRLDARRFDADPRPPVAGGLLDALDAQLPFTLTAAQREVAAELGDDLAGAHPMQRLLQGEVGSGKTVVALRAMLQVVDAGGQAALLAPTEVLAQQHARSIEALLGPLADPMAAGLLRPDGPRTRVALLTGSMGAAPRRAALLAAASGEAGIVVGTHALLGEHVQFADLGLVVVDEQHRFGVEQRDVLRTKAAKVPHTLVMTATPIPRSVAMTVFGDVDTSTMRELPAGRAPVATHVVSQNRPGWMERVWARVAEAVAAGGRAYVVAPRIGEDGGGPAGAAGSAGATGSTGSAGSAGDTDGVDLVTEEGAEKAASDLIAVLELAPQLAAEPALAGIGIGILHGRLAPEEKNRAMADFSSGTVPILVSTTVIEVGVDVPEATVMVVMDANFFGLSQLHQLRGRIGRGDRGGTCFVVARSGGQVSKQRLDTFAGTNDGFALAEADLAYRGEGDVLGRSQSGRDSSLKLLRVIEDADLIEAARVAAWAIIESDPDLAAHPALARATLTLIDPDKEEFLDRA